MKKAIFFHKGAVLIMGMLFLLVLTILGATTMNSSSVQEKMTQNLRDSSLALNAAEAAIGEGEKWLAAQTAPPTPVTTCTQNPCTVWALGLGGQTIQNTEQWWGTYGRPLSTNDFKGVYSQPRYLIEEYSASATALGAYNCYRINARGVGATADAVVNLESIYCIQF